MSSHLVPERHGNVLAKRWSLDIPGARQECVSGEPGRVGQSRACVFGSKMLEIPELIPEPGSWQYPSVRGIEAVTR
jgi:hypothetical protein